MYDAAWWAADNHYNLMPTRYIIFPPIGVALGAAFGYGLVRFLWWAIVDQIRHPEEWT